MKDRMMSRNYAKTFQRLLILFIILAVVTAIAVPLSLSRQISDAAALRQQYALEKQTAASDGVKDGVKEREHHDREDVWKAGSHRSTP